MDGLMRQQLQRFLDRCWSDAQRMWKVFYRFPDFPVHSPGDLFRLLRCVPFDDPLSVPVLLGVLGLSVADVARQYGIPAGSRAWQLINALLLDTAQNDAQRTPYLVGAMGLSILRRGIVRLEDGMKGLFDPWIRGNQDRGLTVLAGVRVVALRSPHATQGGGFELDVVASGGDGIGATETIFARNVVAAFPFGALQQLVPPDDLMRKTNTWHRWDGINARSYEWQALALHGTLVGDDACRVSPADEPWYLQIFPAPRSGIPHAIYLSCGPLKHDLRQGEHYRVFTASLHTELAKDFPSLAAQDASQREGEKKLVTAKISALIAAATGHSVKHASLATPTTFGRYTSRIEGRVGGLEASFENFLFRSPPKVIEASGGCRLVVAGDSVFPGQGVVAASMGGVLAWARITGQDPGKFLKLGLAPATNG
jgi:phytoene dehydrogenase-like protein